MASIAFYGSLFLATTLTIVITCFKHPLFPLQSENLEWSNAWLIATVIDYYGACLCFAGIVLSTELSWIQGIAWVIAFCLLGSPACCLWILLWLWRGGGTLRLERRRSDYSL